MTMLLLLEIIDYSHDLGNLRFGAFVQQFWDFLFWLKKLTFTYNMNVSHFPKSLNHALS